MFYLKLRTGSYYFGARYLDTKTSRWMSADPIYDGVRDGFGIYTYCRNNPIILKDPTGLLSTKTEASMIQAGLGYTNLRVYTYDYYDSTDKQIEGIRNGVSALFDLLTGFPIYSLLDGMSNSTTIKELSICFFKGVGTWLLFDGLGGKMSNLGLKKIGGFWQYTDDFLSYLKSSAQQYGIDTSKNNFDSYLKNLLNLDEYSLKTKKSSAEREFLQEFKDNFKDEYQMYFESSDSGLKLDIDYITDKDQVINKMNQYKKDRINQGKLDYILIDIN